MINNGLFTSEKQTWTTPKYLFDELNEEFNFECDLFASDENALCEKYFTEENDAFKNEWFSCNFGNPPYKTKIQDRAVEYAHFECINGKKTILLIPARTDTKRFHDFIFPYGYKIIFIRGRLKFGKSVNPAPFPSCIVIFDPAVHKEVYK